MLKTLSVILAIALLVSASPILAQEADATPTEPATEDVAGPNPDAATAQPTEEAIKANGRKAKKRQRHEEAPTNDEILRAVQQTVGSVVAMTLFRLIDGAAPDGFTKFKAKGEEEVSYSCAGVSVVVTQTGAVFRDDEPLGRRVYGVEGSVECPEKTSSTTPTAPGKTFNTCERGQVVMVGPAKALCSPPGEPVASAPAE